MTTETTTICLIEAFKRLRGDIPFTPGMLERSKESLIWESLPASSKVISVTPVHPDGLLFDVTYEHNDPEDDMDEPLGERTCTLEGDCESCS